MGNPTIKFKLDEGAFEPVRAHATDGGADIRTPKQFVLSGRSSAIVKTGVHVELPEGTAGMLKSKSGLNVNSDIVSEGVIDQGYTGEIVVKLYNHGTKPHYFHVGDKITQLVVMPVEFPTYVQADEIGGGERGDAGFGSSGR